MDPRHWIDSSLPRKQKRKRREKEARPRHRIEVDRISALPDHLLHHILSFLPTKLAVKTSLLSSRWRNLWATTPSLYFEDDEPSLAGECSSRSLLDLAHLALRNRDPTAPLRSFRLFLRRCYDEVTPSDLEVLVRCYHEVEASDVAALVGRAAEYAIHELHLDLFSVITLPPSILNLASLRVLDLRFLSVRWPPSAWLPSLESLSLSQVDFTGDTARDFVPRSCPRLKRCHMQVCDGLREEFEMSCPLLEVLQLGNLYGVKRIRIAGEMLKMLHIRAGPKEALLISTPNLEEFRWADAAPHHVSMRRPMTSLSFTYINLIYSSDACAGTAALVLGALDSKRLEIRCRRLLGKGVLKGDIEPLPIQTNSGLEHLCLRVDQIDTLNVLGIAFLLKLGPNLKILEIFQETFYDDDFGSEFVAMGGFGQGGFWDSQGLSLERLSCLRIFGAEGTPHEIDLVEFLLRTVTALEEVTIEVSAGAAPCSDWLKIRKTPRASSSVKIVVLFESDVFDLS